MKQKVLSLKILDPVFIQTNPVRPVLKPLLKTAQREEITGVWGLTAYKEGYPVHETLRELIVSILSNIPFKKEETPRDFITLSRHAQFIVSKAIEQLSGKLSWNNLGKLIWPLELYCGEIYRTHLYGVHGISAGDTYFIHVSKGNREAPLKYIEISRRFVVTETGHPPVVNDDIDFFIAEGRIGAS